MGIRIPFTKMEGCGNDYILIDCREWIPEDPGQLSVRLSDRHFGIGSDGLVLICASGYADVQMRMFNADGSEGRMCGNALRCVCKHIYNRKMVENFPLKIETLAGIRTAKMLADGRVSAEMGALSFAPSAIPVLLDGANVLDREVMAGGTLRRISCVSVGNPHCVLFVSDTQTAEVSSIGAAIEQDSLFPERVNVEFVQVLGQNHLQVRVWERGSGETLACGTGACAAAGVAMKLGICDDTKPVIVSMPGGELEVRDMDNILYLTGDAREVFSGIIEI